MWVGSRMDGIDGPSAGDLVTAEQMLRPVRLRAHPLADARVAAAGWPRPHRTRVAGTLRGWVRRSRCRSRRRSFRMKSPSPYELSIPLRGPGGRWPVAAADRAEIRTAGGPEFFDAEHGRGPVDARELAGLIAKDSRPRAQTVAGFDLAFSPVKWCRRYGRWPTRVWRRRSNGPIKPPSTTR